MFSDVSLNAPKARLAAIWPLSTPDICLALLGNGAVEGGSNTQHGLGEPKAWWGHLREKQHPWRNAGCNRGVGRPQVCFYPWKTPK